MIQDRGVQNDFAAIGKDGCYFLSIVAAAERELGKALDVYAAYKALLARKLIEEDCYINDPAGIMAYLCGGTWAWLKKDDTYQQKPGEVVILRFARNEGMTEIAHFVLAGSDGTVEYDPWRNSLTVRSGKLVSKRVIRRIK